MSYHRYLQDELDPSLIAMFEWVTFENEVEDTARYVMSEPGVDDLLVRNYSILPNEVTSLVLSADRTEPIVFPHAPEFPTGDFTVILWVQPRETPGDRGLFQFGDLSIAIETVTDDDFAIAVSTPWQVNQHVVPHVEEGYMVMVTRSGNQFEMFVDNQSVWSSSNSSFDIANADVLIGYASGWSNNPTAEADLQALSLHPFAMTEQQRDDLWSVAFTNGIVRRVEGDSVINLANEQVRVLQSEWHVVGV